MEEITKLFNNPKFGVLEVILIDGKEHYPAIDCAEMLARFCTANGHKVSFMSVKRYYCKHFK